MKIKSSSFQLKKEYLRSKYNFVTKLKAIEACSIHVNFSINKVSILLWKKD